LKLDPLASILFKNTLLFIFLKEIFQITTESTKSICLS